MPPEKTPIPSSYRNETMKYYFLAAFGLIAILGSVGTPSRAADPQPDSPETQSTTLPETDKDSPSDANAEPPALGDYVSFPASGVEIRQPPGFEKADSFDGFGQRQTQSSILAISVPGPYSKIAAGFTLEQMRARGWSLRRREKIEISGMPGILVHFEQPAYGTVFLKWLVAFGDEQSTKLVTAAFPKSQEQELSAVLKAAVLSARLAPSGPADPGAGLPFTIDASEQLKLAPGISNTLLYTKDGTAPIKSPEDPLFVAAPSLVKGLAGDKQQFAEQRLRQTASTKGLVIESTDAITIDGLEGYESVAKAEDARSGTSLVIYQAILFDQDSYVLMQGRVGAESSDTYLPEFKTMARSFKRKTP
jgi:hypothetical protein